MKTRVLGNQDLVVSAMGLGCWGMSHAYGHADEKESIATLNLCLDLGINFLDTADVYGDGHNETLISKVLKTRRKEAVVATKFGFVGDEHNAVRVNGRPEYVRAACESSLKRLGTDRIDLYYLHRLDRNVPVEETVGAMADLICEGKIRCIGLSEVSADTLERACQVHPVTALQSEYSLWHREVEKEVLPACRRLNVSLVPFSPLGRGFLTGKVPGTMDATDYRRNMPRFSPEIMAQNQTVADTLAMLADQAGISASQLSLGWLLAQDPCLVPVPGMKRRAYVRENLAAVEICLSPDLLEKLSALADAVKGARHNAYNLEFIDR